MQIVIDHKLTEKIKRNSHGHNNSSTDKHVGGQVAC